MVEQSEIIDARITFTDDDQAIAAQLDTFSLADDGHKMLALSAAGRINDIPLQLSGRAGPAQAMVTGKQLATDLNIQWGHLSLEIEGSAAELKSLQGIDARVNLNSLTSRPLLELLGVTMASDGKLSLQGHVVTDDSGLRVDTEGRLKDYRVSLAGHLKQPLALDGVDLDFALEGPSLQETGAAFDLPTLPDVPFAIAGKLSREGSLLALHNTTISAADSRMTLTGSLPEFPGIDDWQMHVAGTNINLALLAPVMGLEAIPDQPYDLSGGLSADDDGVELLDFQLTSGTSNMRLNGVMGQAPTYFGTRLHVEVAGDNIADTAPWIGLQQLPQEAFQVSGDVHLDQQGWHLQAGKLTSNSLTMTLDGVIDKLQDPTQLDAQLRIAAPDLAGTLASYGMQTELPPALPITIAADVSGPLERLALEAGEARLANATARFSGQLGNLRDRDQISLKLALEADNLRSILPVTLPGEIPVPLTLTGRLEVTADAAAISEVTGSIPGSEIDISGNVMLGNREAARAVDAHFGVVGKSSRKLEKLLGVQPILSDQPFTMEANLRGGRDRYQLAPLKIVAGDSDLGGSVQLTTGETPEITITLRSEYLHAPFFLPDLDALEREELAKARATESTETEDFTDELSTAELQERVIGTNPLQLEWLNTVNGSLDYSAGTIFFKEGVSSKADLNMTIKDGVLAVDHLDWDGTFTSGISTLTVDASRKPYTFDMKVNGERLPLLWLLAGTPDHRGESMYKAMLKSTGNSPQEIAANLNGAVAFRGEGGRINNSGLDLVLGDFFGELLDLLNPTSETRSYTRVACNAGALVVEDGVIDATPGFVLRTEKLDLLSTGTINLKNERVNMAFSTRTRKGLGLSAGRALTSYVKLGGTLANPRLILDPAGAAVSGGAAVATGGLSILAGSMWDRWIATSGDPCKRLIKAARNDPKRDYRSLLRGATLPAPRT
jgi:uncharacterized protein involved in outer membrane biogenesis